MHHARESREASWLLAREGASPSPLYVRCGNSMSGEHDFHSHHYGKNETKPLSCKYCNHLEVDLIVNKRPKDTT